VIISFEHKIEIMKISELITKKQWKEVLPLPHTGYYNEKPIVCNGDENAPIRGASYIQVQDFIQKLNQKTGKYYRLPTEAEWEKAVDVGLIPPNSDIWVWVEGSECFPNSKNPNNVFNNTRDFIKNVKQIDAKAKGGIHAFDIKSGTYKKSLPTESLSVWVRRKSLEIGFRLID